MTDKTPIIFIHYGDTPYLKYSLDIAQKMNPDKEVVLLGDDKNKKYEKKLGIRHIPFVKYDKKQSVKDFDENFIYIGGANRQTEQDKRFERFCFKRWFYLYEFMEENEIKKCWYFDSDTLILSPLAPEEEKFKEYDATEQCNGQCMKGLITKTALAKFTKGINELLLKEKFMFAQKEKFDKLPGRCFNDMQAYKAHKNASQPKTILLNTIINKETFDECICQKHGMEMEYIPTLKREIKKLYFQNGEIFEKDQATHNLIKLKALNLSWVTTSFVEKVYYYKICGAFPSFHISWFRKLSRVPRFIKTKITKEIK